VRVAGRGVVCGAVVRVASPSVWSMRGRGGVSRSGPCGVEEKRRGPQRAVWGRGEEARAAAGREDMRATAGRAIRADSDFRVGRAGLSREPGARRVEG
jgi:hypothetical protein